MRGFLIVNHYYNTEKFNELYYLLHQAAEKEGVRLTRHTNAEIIKQIAENPSRTEREKPDFVLFWDKDVRLAALLESYGIRTFNKSGAIELCDDKSKTYAALRGKIKMPKTVILPMSFFTVDWNSEFSREFLRAAAENLNYPVVVKECYGSFGEQVYLEHSLENLINRLNAVGNKPVILQEFIKSSSGRDIRLNVVGGKVVAAMERYSVTGDFRANLTNGGKMKPFSPSPEQIEMALLSCEYLDLDFGGVDILFGEDNEPVLCEVNSNTAFKNILDCTGVNVAEHIIRHIGGVINAR